MRCERWWDRKSEQGRETVADTFINMHVKKCISLNYFRLFWFPAERLNQYQFSSIDSHIQIKKFSAATVAADDDYSSFFSLLYRALSLTLSPISFSIPFRILRRIILFYSQKKRIHSSSSSLLLLLLFFHSALVMEFNKCQSDDREMNTKVTNLWITLKWQS